MQGNIVTPQRIPQQLGKPDTVCFIGKDALPGVAPAGQMIERALKFEA